MLRANQRVAVVDDEVNLAFVVCRMLNRMGVEACHFTDPLVFLDALEEDPSSWHLLITDHHMPWGYGTELIRRARQIRPDLATALMTGSIVALGAGPPDEVFVLQKPVGMGDLGALLTDL